MSRVQTTQTFPQMYNQLAAQVAALQRQLAALAFKDINTTGLSSAQIDAAVFGASTDAQPANGLVIVDSTNQLLLARVGGKWGKTALTIIP